VFFDTWAGLGRVLIAGSLAYFALIVILRISGKRTLSKFNAFDLVVTVALGSTLATVLLSKDVALAEGVVALCLLASLQYAIAWLSVRSERFQSLVKSEPTLLVHNGRFLQRAMRQQRVGREEIMAALRESDLSSPAEAHGVVLETDGSISVTRAGASTGDGPAAVLQTVDVTQVTGNT
jgi:uncharacterized membrane protein YcaP (DUF421 family)